MRWRARDPFSCYSHLLGAVLSVAALVALLVWYAKSPRHAVGFAIYGASLVVLYSASAIYHWLQLPPRGEEILRRFDHVAIFGLIAGTYTPVCLVNLCGAWGWSVLGVVWGVALVGTLLQLFYRHMPPRVSTAIYLGMGWVAVVAFAPLARRMPVAGLMWLIGGGLAYTVGSVIYMLERTRLSHEIFHVFVLAGSTLHFVFMARYVAQAT
jgi:hemolysin III